MADDYEPEDLEEERDEEDHTFEPTKDRLVVLVDADQSMLATLEQEGESRSYLAWAMRVAADVMKRRVRGAPGDEVGVVLYGTRDRGASEELRPFDRVCEYVRLATPDAATIRRLDEFDVTELKASPGCGDASAAPGRAAEDLRHGLWACWDLLTKRTGGAARATRTVLIFTNNPDPAAGAPHAREQVLTRARELGGLGAYVEVLPLVQLRDPAAFDYRLFWGAVLLAASEAAAGAGAGAGDEGAEEAAALMRERAEGAGAKLLRLQSLSSRVVRKRPLSACQWTLAPGLAIAVQLFALVKPASRPPAQWVTRAAAEVVRPSNALISSDTGALMQAVAHKAFAPKAMEGGRFPRVVLTADEERRLKSLRPRGLALLGFKPARCLAEHHQLGPSRFVYPDERQQRGSTAAFAALLAACRPGTAAAQMAVCSYVRAAGGMPQLVALLPQIEEVDERGEQLTPNGFHMVALPFRDELRAPEREPALLARSAGPDGAPPRATEEQVAAAAALVRGITLGGCEEEGGGPFASGDIANPHLARHYEVLEARALAASPPPPEAFEDETEPHREGIDAHGASLDGFKLAVWNSLQAPPSPGAKAGAGTKRKAADPDTQAAAAAEYAQHDWQALAAAPEALARLTIPQLKTYLRHHGLPLAGAKPALLERVAQHARGGAG